MSEAPSPALWSTVAALPDYLLLSQTRQLARHEQALQILVLDHLREIEVRRLHLTHGYGSLFDYVVRELGYTAAAAWRRIKAMRLCDQTSGARELLQDGKLNLSNAAQLQNLFERSDRNDRDRGSHGTSGGEGGEPRSDGVPGEPTPVAPTRAGERDPAPGAGPVLDAAAREELVKQAAGKSTREVQQMVAEVDPELAQPSDRMRALGNGRWELKAAIDAECRHGLEKLQMLLSHVDPHLTLGGLVARLVRDGLDRYDPARPPRVRRSGRRNSANGERTARTPARRRTETEHGNAALAAVPSSGGHTTSPTKRRSEAEPGRAARAVAGVGGRTASAPRRGTEAERSSPAPAAAPDSGGCATSAPKRQSEVELGRAARAVAGVGGGPTASAPKRSTEAERNSPAPAVARDGGGRAVSAAKRGTEAERGGAKSAAVRDFGARSASAAKRVTQDEGARTEEAERLCAAGASAPGRRREAEHACGQPKVMRGTDGRVASLGKRHGRAGGDGRDAGVGGVLDRASCAAGPQLERDRRDASRAPVRGGRRFATSAAKRLAYAAGLGAVGPAERSPALERHLATLSCIGTWPGSRSRYIPATVRREVWRRDQGCCSYVDPHSGRRCGSRYRLEIDHIVPFALGGATELFNLRLRCQAHHSLRHAHALRPPRELAGWSPARPGSRVDAVDRGRTVESRDASNRTGA